MLAFVLSLLSVFLVASGQFLECSNKVCETIRDYSPLNPFAKCWSDNDVCLSASDIIVRYGYPLESYKVITDDGYILSLYRIPFGRGIQSGTPGQPIFLQHGILVASDIYVNMKNSSLAFLLADAGYDVWLGNLRGCTYSRSHVNMTTKDTEFWNFNVDDIANYDLPALLDFVSEKTGKRGEIIYIGHSMGTTVSFIYSIDKAEHARKTLKFMINMAPVVRMDNIRSPLRFLGPFTKSISTIIKVFGHGEFLPNEGIVKLLAPGCIELSTALRVCQNVVFLICGFNKDELAPETIPVMLYHNPAGTSIFTVAQFGQIYQSKRFQKFDYGLKTNMEKYGTAEPPEYDLSKVSVPVYLMYGQNDYLADTEDVAYLYSKLPKDIALGIYEVADPKFTHLDFMYGTNVKTLVNDHVLGAIAKFSGSKIVKP